MLSTSDVNVLKSLGDLSEGLFLSVLRASRDCIMIIELDGSILFANDSDQCLSGLDDTQAVLGLDWIALWPDESRDLVAEAFEQAKAGQDARVEACRLTAAGALKWWDVAVSPVRDNAGHVCQIVSVARDITSLVERERHAHEREIQAINLAERQQEKIEELRQQTADAQAAVKTDTVTESLAPDPASDHEEDRLAALIKTGLLDSVEEDRFDNLTKLAADVLGVPTALVSLVDRNRQWFKSRHNFETRETPRSVSFCSQAIETPDEVMVIENAPEDSRVCDNPLVTGGPKIAFYAGVPLVTDSGFPIGTLCVLDYKPRKLSDHEKGVLQSIAATVMTEIALIAKEKERSDLDIINMEMRHRMGNTYARVSSLVSMIGRTEGDKDKFISKLQTNISALARLQSEIALNDWETVDVRDLVMRALDLDDANLAESPYDLDLDEDLVIEAQGAFMLTLALQELVSNASKHGALSVPDGRIQLTVHGNTDGFDILWEERGAAPEDHTVDAGTGFGSELLTRIVPMSLSGTAEHEIVPGVGCRYRLTVTS